MSTCSPIVQSSLITLGNWKIHWREEHNDAYKVIHDIKLATSGSTLLLILESSVSLVEELLQCQVNLNSSYRVSPKNSDSESFWVIDFSTNFMFYDYFGLFSKILIKWILLSKKMQKIIWFYEFWLCFEWRTFLNVINFNSFA